ncbi:MAG: hypothetical protein ACRDE5_02845 [Ginsengibacter sp.]
MKKNYFITGIALFTATALTAQIKMVRPAMQTKVQTTAVKPQLEHVESAKPNTPPPANKDILSASITISTGDDGKEEYTSMGAQLWDNNKRIAAYYNIQWDNMGVAQIYTGSPVEYYTETTVSLPMVTRPSIPTGEIKMNGALPLPVCRMATQADFNIGGELRIGIWCADAHIDIWKISKIRLRVTFNNDNGSPHTITWNNITLSNNSTYIDLLFDKTLNAIQ